MRFLVEKEITAERFILNGENSSFHNFFNQIAKALNVKAPSIQIKPWVSAIVWRLEKIRSIIRGKSPFITKETAHSSQQHYHYNADKIKALGFHFRPLNETIIDTCNALKNS